jgi:hypothetical protein
MSEEEDVSAESSSTLNESEVVELGSKSRVSSVIVRPVNIKDRGESEEGKGEDEDTAEALTSSLTSPNATSALLTKANVKLSSPDTSTHSPISPTTASMMKDMTSVDDNQDDLSPSSSAIGRNVLLQNIRTFVSKKKTRHIQGSFNLDLTYIHPRIIAMGYPSEGIESAYRNPAADVSAFLDRSHNGHYMVYNLCEDRHYSHNLFHGRVREFPFPDHTPPPMALIPEVCKDMQSYWDEDDRNVLVVHCKAGKGRTGVVISSFLIHSGLCATATDAFHLYSVKRTVNNKGVTIPSQIRYITYYEAYLLMKRLGNPHLLNFVSTCRSSPIRIHSIELSSTPHISSLTGYFTPVVKIYDIFGKKLFSSRSGVHGGADDEEGGAVSWGGGHGEGEEGGKHSTFHYGNMSSTAVISTTAASEESRRGGVKLEAWKGSSSRVKNKTKGVVVIDSDLFQSLNISGDIKISIVHESIAGDTKLFHFCLNTFMLLQDPRVERTPHEASAELLQVKFTKDELDHACKDTSHKIYSEDFTCVLKFFDDSLPSSESVAGSTGGGEGQTTPANTASLSLTDEGPSTLLPSSSSSSTDPPVLRRSSSTSSKIASVLSSSVLAGSMGNNGKNINNSIHTIATLTEQLAVCESKLVVAKEENESLRRRAEVAEMISLRAMGAVNDGLLSLSTETYLLRRHLLGSSEKSDLVETLSKRVAVLQDRHSLLESEFKLESANSAFRTEERSIVKGVIHQLGESLEWNDVDKMKALIHDLKDITKEW